MILQQPKPRHPKRLHASFLDHPYPHLKSLDTFVSEWVDSVTSREKLCRSDSHLYRPDVEPVSRQLTRSAPVMSFTTEFKVPPTPPSTRPQLRSPSITDSRFSADGASGTHGSSSSIRDRMYRQNNLELNHIYIRRPDAPLPSAVSSYINDTLHARRDSPNLSAEDIKGAMYRLNTLAEGCDEDDVVDFLNSTIFPDPRIDQLHGPTTGLMSSSYALMSQHLVPVDHESPYRVSQPKPGKLYGYSGNANRAFTQPQLLAQTTLNPQIPNYPVATSQGLRFPFLAIEFKAAGGTRGDLWVATNQCAGASAACLNAIDQLNESLRKHQRIERVDNLAFCIAVDNNTAQLYISWKEDNLNYYLQRVNTFLLSEQQGFKNFRKQVRNILDWAKDVHLNNIRDALDTVLEENRKSVSEAAKSRPPPSVSSTEQDV
ncbi:hypothetical protein GGR51DRAFT_169091 [Nemania sp. FL0031]|nr:hypothetical protein GGR51DRAFT_169091 [Nemania sp. FL0031]